MNIFGLTITRQEAAAVPSSPAALERRGGGGWWPIVREPYSGAWQQNVTAPLPDLLAHPTVFACVTLIAADIAKMRLRLVALDDDGIWTETDSPAFSPVLRKPNRYQTRITFIKTWMMSKLAHGNTYVLKQRDQRRIVTALYVLDPQRVQVLVAPDGSIYYELQRDNLSSQPRDRIVVPASEIIHDLMNPLYHPLVGIAPIYACGLAATLGLKIQTNSARFFQNQSLPSGMLTAPGAISTETADRLKADFETKFSGENLGRLLVAGDGVKFEPFTMAAVEAQLTEQWESTSLAICSTYHVPAYKVGVGDPPSYNNVEALDRQYYSQCLQEHIESIELLLDEGLELPKPYGTEFDLDDLLRLDSATMVNTLASGIGAALFSPNEARKKMNQPPVKGGDVPIVQQQYWPLDQLSARPTPGSVTRPPPPGPAEAEGSEEAEA